MVDLQLAKEAAGNWQHFDSFAWFARPEDAHNGTIYHTVNRDSGLLAQSNAAEIDKRLAPFTKGKYPTAISQRFSHWACGWVDAYAIKVFNNKGELTEAFQELCKIKDELESYLVLNGEDYSEREYKATIENIRDAAWRFELKEDAPEDWPYQAFDWFWQNADHEVENVDDQGGYPSKEGMRRCLTALDLLAPEED